MTSRKNFKTGQLRRTTLAISLGLGLGLVSMGTMAQSTTGSVFGRAAPGADTTVVIKNVNTGQALSTSVDSAGRYRFSSLPAGTYSVTLRQGGADVATRDNIAVNIAGGTEVSFAGGDVTALDAVSVSASALPAIDVSAVDTKTVFTSEQLAKLPMARNVNAAALLAPGVVGGDSRYGNVVSFGGSSASENAYYINGYAVTNPLTNLGSTTLPFDAIDQMQVITGGYGADYGRSTGGVVNIATKRGSNVWNAGAAFYWTPSGLRGTPRNIYYTDVGSATDGKYYQYRARNLNWQSTSGVYIGGPLIKDKLFLYASGEFTRDEGQAVQARPTALTSVGKTETVSQTPRWLVKLDWNITDNHILEFTGLSDKQGRDVDYYTKYSVYDSSRPEGNVEKSGGYRYKDGGELYIGKYTGYITDNLTVTALYGTQKQLHYAVPFGYDPTQISVTDSRGAATTVPNRQPYGQLDWADANDETKGGRLDIEYRLGDHNFRVGYDRQEAVSKAGEGPSGPGYRWIYYNTGEPNNPIPASGGAAGPGGNGDYVVKYVYANGGVFKVVQESQYLEDTWQINDRWMAKIGIRNEQFSNYNSDGVVYVKQRHQLAPRLGISWDVNGDSSLKVFANAGRYHLSMPNNVALRGAAGSTYTTEYFGFAGWDPVTGVPNGLTPLGKGPYSANNEYGQAPDPRTVAAKGLKSHYQDEYILGMEKQLSSNLNVGAKLTYRDLKSAIDDICDPRAAIKWAQANNIDPFLDGGIADSLNNCRLFNPGQGNTFELEDGNGGFVTIPLTAKELGFPALKRRYMALDLYVEYPFDGKWYGKLDYTFSRNYGNAEGQLLSDVGQGDVSQTMLWDHVELMEGANGPLPNDRPHQLKGYGFYQMTPEWRFGATAVATSGRPKNCTGIYPEDFGYADPREDDGFSYMAYGGPYYHFCNKEISPRGSAGRMPWNYRLDLNVAYQPSFADSRLELKLDVFNVFNRQSVQNIVEYYELGGFGNRYNQSNRPISFSQPRYFRFSAKYDFSL